MALGPRPTYSEQLKDPRWKKRRLEILTQRGEKCQLCSTTKDLEVHHGYYTFRYYAWEYPDEVLWCLCRKCHDETQAKMTAIHAIIGEIHPRDLDSLKNKLGNSAFEIQIGITREEAEEILAEERRAESVLYADYSIELLFSDENGPSHVDEFEALAEDRFPGIRIETIKNVSTRDCVGTVSGPDPELRSMIQSWVDKFAS